MAATVIQILKTAIQNRVERLYPHTCSWVGFRCKAMVSLHYPYDNKSADSYQLAVGTYYFYMYPGFIKQGFLINSNILQGSLCL